MWAYTVFFIAVAIFSALMPIEFIKGHPDNYQQHKAEAIAQNFIIYRNSIREYAGNNPGFSGEITTNTLPNTWRDTGLWTNTMSSGIAYVYGDPPPGVEAVVMDKLGYPINTGVKSGGVLVSQAPSGGNKITNDVPIPASVPAGNLVSVFKVN